MLESIRAFVDGHQTLLTWLAVGSGIMLLVSILTLPVLAVLLPTDLPQRLDPDRKRVPSRQHPVVWWTLRILKNLVGVLLLVAGLAMLVLPGQGLITLAFSLVLLDLPGKRRLEARILRSPRVLNPVNRLRRRFNRPPLVWDPKP